MTRGPSGGTLTLIPGSAGTSPLQRSREHPQGCCELRVLLPPSLPDPPGFAAGESPPQLRLRSKMPAKPSGGGGKKKNPQQQLDAARGCSRRLRTEIPPRRGESECCHQPGTAWAHGERSWAAAEPSAGNAVPAEPGTARLPPRCFPVIC